MIAKNTPENVYSMISMPTMTGCWLWKGCTVKGYGHVGYERKYYRVHRLIFSWNTGKQIPDGCDLHHKCGNKSCCNPLHLEVLTKSQHSKIQPSTTKTHCKHGHVYTEQNTGRTREGRRKCITCSRLRTERRAASGEYRVSGKKYYKQNREKVLEQNKEYYKNNRERVLARVRAYDAKNITKRRERDKVRYYLNKKQKETQHDYNVL